MASRNGVSRVTIKDIASKLNVSANTVSKALNNKSQISEKTRKLILSTASEMNYIPNKAAKSLVRKEISIAVVYPIEPHVFYSYIIEGIQRAEIELVDSRCTIHHFPYSSLENPDEVKAILRSINSMSFDGLVITCSHRCDSYIDELKSFAQNKPIIYNTIFGPDVPGLLGGVRMNTRLAGRMAAEFIHLTLKDFTRPIKVALFSGEKQLLVHKECIEGFTFEAQHLNIDIVDIVETFEDNHRIYNETELLMARCPDLDAIYVTSATSPAVCNWFEDHPEMHKPIIIGHDLYPELNSKLRSHVLDSTLFQNQFEYGRESIYMLYEYIINARNRDNCFKLMTPQLVLSSMLEAFPYYD